MATDAVARTVENAIGSRGRGHVEARRRALLTATALLVIACGAPRPSAIPTPTVQARPTTSTIAATEPPATDAPIATAPDGQSVPAHSVVVMDAETLEVLDVIAVGPDPKMLGVAGGQVWTLNLGDGGFSRIDPATRQVTAVRLAGEAVGMTVDGEDVWAAHDGRFLTRIAGATGKPVATVELAPEPIFALRNAGFLDVDAGTAWLTVPDLARADLPQELWAVDTGTGEHLETYPLARDPVFPIVGEGAVWVPVLGSRGVMRLDLATRQLVKTDPGRNDVAVAVGDGAIWAVSELDESVDHLSPDGAVVAEIELPWRGRGIAAGPGVVYASTEGGVTLIDAQTDTVLRSADLMALIRHGYGPTALAHSDGLIWVAIE